MDGQPEMRVQIVGEPAHLFRLGALRSAQAQWQPNHNFPDVVSRQHLSQGLQITTLVLTLDRLQPLSRDSERVRNGDSDSFRANIEGHDAPMADRPRCIHLLIVDGRSGKLLADGNPNGATGASAVRRAKLTST